MNHERSRMGFLFMLLLLCLVALLGCGGGGGNNGGGTPPPPPPPPPQNVTVTVNPPAGFTGFIGVTQTIQFTATVTGTTNTSVTWSVNTVPGGNSTVGTVNSSGQYSAPNQIPNPQKVTVTATSQADTTKSASTTVFVSRIPPSGAWQRSGPPGGTITVLVEDVSNPGTVYAGTDNAGNGGLWKSTDAGAHWTPIVTNTELDSGPAFDIAIPASGSGKVIYVCDDFGFSADGGATWTPITTPAGTRAMAVDPNNRAVIYLSAPGKGVLKSSDAGMTWALLPSSPVIGSTSVTATLHNPLAIDATQSSTIYYGTDHGMFVSKDSGAIWNPSTTGFAGFDTAIRDVAVKGPSVFALAGQGTSAVANLYQSTDHGTSWTPLASGLDGERIVPDPASSTTLYLYGLQIHAVYKSTDGGHTFNPSDSGMPSGSSGPLAVIGPSGILLPLTTSPTTFLATIGGVGIFRSQDAAASWGLSTQGVSAWFGDAVAFDPSVPSTIYLTATNGGGIFKSTDSGVTWGNLRHDNAHAIAIDPFNSAHLLAAATDEGLIESNDGGTSWHTITTLPPPPGGFAILNGITFHPNQQGTIFIPAQGGGVGVLKSTDGGATWNFAKSGLTTDQALSAVTVNPQNPSMLFLGTTSGIFKSTDSGNSWTLKTSIKTAMFSIDTKANPLAIYASGAKSTDLGETWQTVANAGIMVVDPSTPNSVFSVSVDLAAPRATLWSPDGGTTWFPFGSGLGQPNLTTGFGGGGVSIAPSSPQVLFVASTSNSVVRFVVGP